MHATVVVPQSVIIVATHSRSCSEKHKSTIFCSDWDAMSDVERFRSIIIGGSALAIRDASMLVVDNVTSTSIWRDMQLSILLILNSTDVRLGGSSE